MYHVFPMHGDPAMKEMPPEALEQVAAYFQVLAEPTRLRILNLLRDGEKNVGDLAQQCGYTAANVSRHLSLMTKHGAVARLKNAQRQTLRHRFAQGSAAFQFIAADALPGQNRFWRLRVGADNEGLCDGPQAPAGRNAFHLPGRVVPIAARADQACIGATIDVVEHGVVAAVKKILELPADGCKVFRGGKNEPVRAQHVCGASL